VENVFLTMDCFSTLTPDRFLAAVEDALGLPLTALARSLPSYINRVYEIQTVDKSGYIVKFYRPGRWSLDALREEHQFLFDCAHIDIPVVCPCTLTNNKTLGQFEEISFTIFPKRLGRQFDIEREEDWSRIGSLLGRIHNAGQAGEAPSRVCLHPVTTTQRYVNLLLKEVVPQHYKQKYGDICNRIIEILSPHFEGLESIRIHGDFHAGNILQRPGEGLLVIDFDDMMKGPPVQDFWLLLPDYYPESNYYIQKLLEGYRQFRDMDTRSLRLIEGLRAMRMIYFTTWCSMQRDDYQYKQKFPDWGTDKFWSREIQDLQEQHGRLLDSL
jgi:Ser/Thr protein kinase RdoA (MazF antagonist)